MAGIKTARTTAMAGTTTARTNKNEHPNSTKNLQNLGRRNHPNVRGRTTTTLQSHPGKSLLATSPISRERSRKGWLWGILSRRVSYWPDTCHWLMVRFRIEIMCTHWRPYSRVPDTQLIVWRMGRGLAVLTTSSRGRWPLAEANVCLITSWPQPLPWEFLLVIPF